MNGRDAELETLRSVSCVVLLEQLPPPWALDRRDGARRCLRYRRGAGEVLIVNHDGRGWWDPQSECKGDVFDLVQHLQPGLHFGQVRRVLWEFVGIAPTCREVLRERARHGGGSRGGERTPAAAGRAERLERRPKSAGGRMVNSVLPAGFPSAVPSIHAAGTPRCESCFGP